MQSPSWPISIHQVGRFLFTKLAETKQFQLDIYILSFLWFMLRKKFHASELFVSYAQNPDLSKIRKKRFRDVAASRRAALASRIPPAPLQRPVTDIRSVEKIFTINALDGSQGLVVMSRAAQAKYHALPLDADLALRGNQSSAGISIPNFLDTRLATNRASEHEE